jgi:hypothetical protein
LSEREERRRYLELMLARESPPAVLTLAQAILKRHEGAAVILYGSGASVMSDAPPSDIIYDFYVIATDYGAVRQSFFQSLLNRILPPNVFYIEAGESGERLRAKYATLSIAHLEELVGRRTFHSYFWARFAQPCRIVEAPAALRERITAAVETAVDVFVARSANLRGTDGTAGAVWREGLARSYRAELRAEPPDRVQRLLASYGDWPKRVTIFPALQRAPAFDEAQWRLRALQGALLSAARLLKATFTFDGGVDYIAFKISRHAGFALPVREWERRWPLLSWPILAGRYYRMRRNLAKGRG